MSDAFTGVPAVSPAPPAPPSSTKTFRKSEVGDLRPSQALTTFGVGSLIDLPNLSVLVLGLDDWQPTRAEEISEERLLLSAQRVLGPQVTKLLTPPRTPETAGGGGLANWFDDSHTTGIPVAPFPRWLVCSGCRLLAPISSSLFEPKVEPYRPDRTRYVHNCTSRGRAPVALPARFLVACPNGHLDDFPWLDFVHRGKGDCPGPLELYEIGASGEASDVEVHCQGCKSRRRMADAFGQDNQVNMPACRGRRPHLRDWQPDAAARGVRITVVIETPDRLEGENAYSTLKALGSQVAAAASVYYWPTEKRKRNASGKAGILHVKCAVADGHSLFLSSANLTSYAFDLNMELGLLVTGGTVPRRVEDTFGHLIASQVLQEIRS